MKRTKLMSVAALLAVAGTAITLVFTHVAHGDTNTNPPERSSQDLEPWGNGQWQVAEGRQIFRYDTFGDEAFWGDALRLHQAIAGEKNGGVGPGLSPKNALAAGLKVDVDALPKDVRQQIKSGTSNLDDPATTVALLRLNAVVGVTGLFDANGKLRSMGVQCARIPAAALARSSTHSSRDRSRDA